MNCITVLTRGYRDINQYNKLINRNLHISQNLRNKSIDILIFHEGNITNDHMIHIQKYTPELKIIFIDVSIHFQEHKKNIIVEDKYDPSVGYRHMCSFWFVHFFDFVKKYNKLIRIDEDCYIKTNIDDIFSKLDNYTFICGKKMPDDDFVTIGLNNFTLNFIKNKNVKNTNSKKPDGPYTNFFAILLDPVRDNDIFNEYKKEIDKSDMIYKRRWGDLSLWGEAIYYIFGENTLLIDKSVKYFHESHHTGVNM